MPTIQDRFQGDSVQGPARGWNYPDALFVGKVAAKYFSILFKVAAKYFSIFFKVAAKYFFLFKTKFAFNGVGNHNFKPNIPFLGKVS